MLVKNSGGPPCHFAPPTPRTPRSLGRIPGGVLVSFCERVALGGDSQSAAEPAHRREPSARGGGWRGGEETWRVGRLRTNTEERRTRARGGPRGGPCARPGGATTRLSYDADGAAGTRAARPQ